MFLWRQIRHGCRGLSERAGREQDVADEVAQYFEEAESERALSGYRICISEFCLRIIRVDDPLIQNCDLLFCGNKMAKQRMVLLRDRSYFCNKQEATEFRENHIDAIT
jgi:hypothetical protein